MHSDKHLLYCSLDANWKALVTREQFRRDVGMNMDKILQSVASEQPVTDSEHSAELNKFLERYGLTAAHYGILYFLPAYERYNRQIADWTREMGLNRD